MRDLTCLSAYWFLKFLWPCSYVLATLHILNAAAVLAGRGPRPGVLTNPYIVPAASFFGVFFIMHCIFVVFRNALLGIRIVKRLNLGFVLSASAFGVADAATARSIAVVDESTSRILTRAVLAVGTYLFYRYARRIRAKCTSLSAGG